MISRYLIERPLVRATALVAVAFMLLASGRTIVPEVCATQQALESCHEPVQPTVSDGCCAAEFATLASGEEPEQVSGGAVRCGLCVLATGLVLPLEQGTRVSPGDAFDVSVTVPVAAPVLPALWSPRNSRGPPAAV